ncbi:MAG: hypothetical protein R6X15_03795 [Pseudomonadota bacterium]
MQEFTIVNIEKTQPPANGLGGDWYQYTIVNGSTEIKGLRCGSKTEVKAFAESSTQRLNSRNKAAFQRN